MNSNQIREVVALSARKAHMEASKRTLTVLQQELRDSGLYQELSPEEKLELTCSLSVVSALLARGEETISTKLDDLRFAMESEVENNI